MRIEPYPTPLDIAARTLFPWEQTAYPGFLKGVVELFQNRAAMYTIRDWRTGRRRAPRWASTLMIQELQRRIHAMQHACALLQADEKKRPAG